MTIRSTVCIALIIAVLKISETREDVLKSVIANETCRTKECDAIADRILSGLNTSVDPCEDFYEYVCGAWPSRNPIPADRNTWSVQAQLAARMLDRLRGIVEEKEKYNDSAPLKMAKAWYRSCMDVATLEAQGLTPLLRLLNENGGWPALAKNWTGLPENMTWLSLRNKYERLYGIHAFFKLHVYMDNVEEKIMIGVEGATNIPLSDMANSVSHSMRLLNAYSTMMNEVFAAFLKATNSSRTLDDINSEILKVHEIALRLQLNSAVASPWASEKMTIAELQAFYDNYETNLSKPLSQIDWLDTIKYAFQESSVNINERTVIKVKNKNNLILLREMLDNFTPRDLVNYIQWVTVTTFMQYTNEQMRNLEFALKNVSLFYESPEPRWKTCILNSDTREGLITEYIKRSPAKHLIPNVLEMARDIVREMKNYVTQSSTFPLKMQQFALRKLNSTGVAVGYPRTFTDETSMIERFKGLTIGSNYFENVLNSYRFSTRRQIELYGKPYNKMQWFHEPSTVNAFYYITSNIIVLPLGRFEEIDISASVPLSILYGDLGFVIGHELSHAFTGIGLNYDENGTVMSASFNVSSTLYEKTERCIADHYSRYILHDSNSPNASVYLDGDMTNNENLADAIGAQVAYNAYKYRAKNETNRPVKLPRLEKFTGDQLFFVSVASVWCETVRPAYQLFAADKDIHAPLRYRVMGTLSNMQDFATAFNCPKTARMNVPNKCSFD